MKTPTKFREYIWLVNTIRKAGKISLQEINEKWLDTEMSEGIEMARSTFNRHKDAIEDMFGIYIDCDRKDGYRYYIGNANVLKENSVQNWMLSTLSVNNVISESLSLQDKILLEPVQSEGEFLRLVMTAIKKKVKIIVTYKKYGSDTVKQSEFEPYCIKLFRQRWYVLAHFHFDAKDDKPEKNYFSVYSFDRIEDIKLTDTKFEFPEDFSAKDFFDQCFGVYIGDDKLELTRIVIRAFGVRRNYLRDLPLHSSQKEIGQGDDYADFEYYIKPTADFCGHIISFTSQLKVMSPDWFAQKIKEMLEETIERYE